jgi:hypothetical protein
MLKILILFAKDEWAQNANTVMAEMVTLVADFMIACLYGTYKSLRASASRSSGIRTFVLDIC